MTGVQTCALPISRPAALDHARYRRFEQFLLDAGMIENHTPVSGLAMDLNAE